MSDSLLGKIIGGWQLSGLFIAQSGTAADHHAAATRCSTRRATPRSPISTARTTVLGGLGPGQLYFDPAVYSLPAAGTQGNMKRNSGPEGPGFWNLDGSLFKRFDVGGSRFAEFRVDAFNVTNSVRWGNPSTGFSTAARQHVRPDHRNDRRPAQPPLRRPVRVLARQLLTPNS